MPTLNWIGKDKVVNHAAAVPFHVLEHKYNYGGESENKIIHGDNLLALKSLLPEYEGRIKCIYIDPPYNTGNEGWIYNDKVNSPQIKKWLGEVVGKEGEDLSRHDKWLCMMYPRLKLLKRLLADDGAIFISIDDNEQANLKFICDEIFGANNFKSNISWQKRYTRSNNTVDFTTVIEHILVYAKTSLFQVNLLPRTTEADKRYTNPDNDIRGLWKGASFLNPATPEKRPNLCYPITNPNTGKITLPSTNAWRRSKEQYEELLKENKLYWGVDGKADVPSVKMFLSEARGLTPINFWDHKYAGNTDMGTADLKSVLGIKVFDNPKPILLLERVLEHVVKYDENAIILDSFAGSGTTAHAVLKLNAEDGGNRKFILVEMEDYAEKITAERVRRVIQGYEKVEGTGGNFDFYEIGEPLMIDGNLNENVDAEKIRAYIWYTETNTQYKKPLDNIPSYLGEHTGTGYYFYYEKDNRTTLDFDFLATLQTRAENYVIYADECLVDEDTLQRYKIQFKKIPRDIREI